MEATLKASLVEAGVSEAAITTLEEQELATEAALKRGYSYDNFIGMGIKAGSARILAERYPRPTGTPTEPLGVPTTTASVPTKLYLGKEPLSELLPRAAQGDQDAVADLLERFGNKTVFVRDLKTGKMDVVQSLACIAFVGSGNPVDYWQQVPTESLSAILVERRMANPLTGKALTPGDPWLDMPRERRVLVCYALLTGAITQSVDEDTLLSQLSQNTLSARWTRIENAFTLAKARGESTVTEAEQRVYEAFGRSASGNIPRGGRMRGTRENYYGFQTPDSFKEVSAEDYYNK